MAAKSASRSTKRPVTKKKNNNKSGLWNFRERFNLTSAIIIALILVVIGFVIWKVQAGASPWEAEFWTKSSATQISTVNDSSASNGQYIQFLASTPTPTPIASNYNANLAKLLTSQYRNTDAENVPYLNTPSSQLDQNRLAGSADSYGTQFASNGQGVFRIRCDFSHFSYDDPILYKGQPGMAHLHMNFGNTHTNAFSDSNTLLNTGGSTCNGQEFNRTAYWVPAMIDQNSNLRVPDDIWVYYKTFGPAIGKVESFPANLQMIATNSANAIFSGEYFRCTQAGANAFNMTKNSQNTVPSCSQSDFGSATVMEMNIQFQQCWNGLDPSNYKANIRPQTGNFFSGTCPAGYNHFFPTLEYKIWYNINPGENTSQWFLSSDVDMSNHVLRSDHGGSAHGDWFGAWNPTVNKLWVDNCSNKDATDCMEGSLQGNNKVPPYARLPYRHEYHGPWAIPGAEVYSKICGNGKAISKPTDLAFCM